MPMADLGENGTRGRKGDQAHTHPARNHALVREFFINCQENSQLYRIPPRAGNPDIQSRASQTGIVQVMPMQLYDSTHRRLQPGVIIGQLRRGKRWLAITVETRGLVVSERRREGCQVACGCKQHRLAQIAGSTEESILRDHLDTKRQGTSVLPGAYPCECGEQ